MGTPEDRLGKVRIISRLYELINSLNEEQQTSLIKQLFQGELPKYIFKMIIDMPDAQQLMIIDQLEVMIEGERLWDEENVNVLDIDTRRGTRTPCVILVDFSTEDLSAQEFIHDISIDGAFIKTGHSLVLGQEVALSFSVPNFEKSFDLAGKVVRSNGEGIGVQFTNLSKKQQSIMKSFIKSMDKA